MTRYILVPLLALLPLTGYGCANTGSTTWTISSGSKTIMSKERREKIESDPVLKEQYKTFVVWGNHAGANSAAIEELQKGSMKVVERARLQQIFDGQQIRLTHTTDDDANILKVGRLVGAGSVLFVETADRSEAVSGAFVGPYSGASRSNTVHHVSVSVRAVDGETGIIMYSGHSTLNRPITDPEVAPPMLARAALHRAVCRIDKGDEWIEMGTRADSWWGCRKKEDAKRSVDE
jgi:curli biogenesis system outer membrane secretion channel CsgG